MKIEYNKNLGHMTYILKGNDNLGESGDFIYIEIDDFFEGVSPSIKEYIFRRAKEGEPVYDIEGKRTEFFDSIVEEIKLIQQPKKIQDEIKEIKAWLTSKDYIVNKVFLGEWESTDERFIEYKKERILKQLRLKELGE